MKFCLTLIRKKTMINLVMPMQTHLVEDLQVAILLVVVRLLDQTLRDIFLQLCLDIMASANDAESEADAVGRANPADRSLGKAGQHDSRRQAAREQRCLP